MEPLSTATRLRARAGVDFRAMDAGGMLVNVETGACFQLNRVGAELWSHFAASGSVESAIELLRRRYTQAESRIASDVTRLCTELVEAGLLTIVPSTGGRDGD